VTATFEQREEISQLIDKLTPETTAGYNDEPIPSATDRAISRLVQDLVDLTLGDREQILYDWLDQTQLAALSTFSVRMSSLAVRTKSRELLVTALLAEAFEGYRVDFRDGGIQALGVAYDAAGRIGEDQAVLFEEAAALARPEMADDMRAFMKRTDLSEILSAMRYREGSEPGGFRYEYIGMPPIQSGKVEES
jgi:hypothetical protein